MRRPQGPPWPHWTDAVAMTLAVFVCLWMHQWGAPLWKTLLVAFLIGNLTMLVYRTTRRKA